MWGKLQTHGDKKNDAEVLAIAAAGAPLDVMAMFFESHIEELLAAWGRYPSAKPLRGLGCFLGSPVVLDVLLECRMPPHDG